MKKPQLSAKDIKIIKGKVAGKTSKEIAAEVYPNAKHGDDIVRARLSQNVTIRDAVQAEMIRQGITLEKVIKPITEALDASQPVYTKDGTYIDSVPMHSVRLQASDRASKLLGIDKAVTGDDNSGELSPEDIKALASASDEMTLTQLIFKRSS